MKLNEYQEQARVTRTRNNEIGPIAYPALGLAGEAGEVADKVKRIYRDDGGAVTPARREALKLELGDVLWYVSALADDLALSLDEVARANIEKIMSRRARGTTKGEGDNR